MDANLENAWAMRTGALLLALARNPLFAATLTGVALHKCRVEVAGNDLVWADLGHRTVGSVVAVGNVQHVRVFLPSAPCAGPAPARGE
jgi:hypothetical protein